MPEDKDKKNNVRRPGTVSGSRGGIRVSGTATEKSKTMVRPQTSPVKKRTSRNIDKKDSTVPPIEVKRDNFVRPGSPSSEGSRTSRRNQDSYFINNESLRAGNKKYNEEIKDRNAFLLGTLREEFEKPIPNRGAKYLEAIVENPIDVIADKLYKIREIKQKYSSKNEFKKFIENNLEICILEFREQVMRGTSPSLQEKKGKDGLYESRGAFLSPQVHKKFSAICKVAESCSLDNLPINSIPPGFKIKEELDKQKSNFATNLEKELNANAKELYKLISKVKDSSDKKLISEVKEDSIKLINGLSDKGYSNEDIKKYFGVPFLESLKGNISNDSNFDFSNPTLYSINVNVTKYLDSLSNKIDKKITDDNNHLKQDNTKLRSQIDSKNKELSDKQQELDSVSGELKKQKNQNVELQNKNDTLSKQNAEQLKQNDTLKQTIKEQSEDLSKKDKELKDKDKELADKSAEIEKQKDKIQDQKKTIDSQKDEISNLTKENENLSNQVTSLKQDIVKKDAQINEQKIKIGDLETENSKQKEQIATLDKKVKDSELKITNLEGELSEVKKDLRNTTEKLEKSEKKVESLTKSNKKLEETNEKLKSELSTARKEVKAQKEIADNAKKAKEESDEKNKLLQEKISDLEKDLEESKQKIEAEKQKAESAVADANTEKNKALSALSSVKGHLKSAHNAVKKRRKQLKRQKKLNNIQKKEVERLKSELKSQKEANNLSEKQLKAKEEQISELKKGVKQLEAKNAALNETIIDQNGIINNLTSEKQKLEKNIGELQGKISDLESENENLKKEVAQQKEENTALRKENTELKNEIVGLKDENSKLKSEVEKLNNTVKQHEETIAAQQQKIENQEKEIKDKDNKIYNLEKENMEIKEENSKKLAEKDEQIEQQKNALGEKDTEIEELKKQIAQMQKEKEEAALQQEKKQEASESTQATQTSTLSDRFNAAESEMNSTTESKFPAIKSTNTKEFERFAQQTHQNENNKNISGEMHESPKLTISSEGVDVEPNSNSSDFNDVQLSEDIRLRLEKIALKESQKLWKSDKIDGQGGLAGFMQNKYQRSSAQLSASPTPEKLKKYGGDQKLYEQYKESYKNLYLDESGSARFKVANKTDTNNFIVTDTLNKINLIASSDKNGSFSVTSNNYGELGPEERKLDLLLKTEIAIKRSIQKYTETGDESYLNMKISGCEDYPEAAVQLYQSIGVMNAELNKAFTASGAKPLQIKVTFDDKTAKVVEGKLPLPEQQQTQENKQITKSKI